MCIRYVGKFKCGHTVGYTDTDSCRTKDCANPREVEEDRPDEDCFDCIGAMPFQDRYDGPTLYFKHCFQSEICDHEYAHMITDVDRPPYELEVVLVTPMKTLCPDCQSAGYDPCPGESNPPPFTRSMMPQEFEDLPRRIENDDGTASTVPFGTSMRPRDEERRAAGGMSLIAERQEREEVSPYRTGEPDSSRRTIASAAPPYKTTASSPLQNADSYSRIAASSYMPTRPALGNTSSAAQAPSMSRAPPPNPISSSSSRPPSSSSRMPPHHPPPTDPQQPTP